MKLYQRQTNINSPSTLSVNSDVFAELLRINNENLEFNFSFTVNSKNIKNYSKVIVTVKDKSQNKDSIKNSYNFRPNNGLLKPKVTPQVAKKLYSGLKVINDLNTEENFIARQETNIASFASDVLNNIYSITEMSIVDKSKQNDIVRSISTSGIDPYNCIDKINQTLCDITEIISDDFIRGLKSNSEFFLDDSKNFFSSNQIKNLFYFQLSKFYLLEIQKIEQEESIDFFETKSTTKKLEEITIDVPITISKNHAELNLEATFELISTLNTVSETVKVNFFPQKHIEAYEYISTPPEINSIVSYDNDSLECSLSIIDKNKGSKIKGFNLYVKDIFQNGNVSSYRRIGSIENFGNNSFKFKLTTNLAVVRVIPVDSFNHESSVYSDAVVGKGYKNLGFLTILVSHFGKNSNRVEVKNIPNDMTQMTLYRRDCTDNIDQKFEIIDTHKIDANNTNVVFNDARINSGRVYEYYVFGLRISDKNKEEIPVISNFVMHKSYSSGVTEKSISVSLTDVSLNTDPKNPSVSFKISTKVSQTENERITQTLKEQIGELYEQYLNPSSNASSPLGDSKGVPQYSDLFFHEIVRTNLNTSERETFDLIGEGVFQDNEETQKINNVKPINPQQSYTYQVFTYKKNPIELFKKFVAKGIDQKGREWFYLPYKWKNPYVVSGRLYPDDPSSNTPVIDAYESFTSESFGLTASYQINGSSAFNSLSNIQTERIDRNTIKISWSTEGLSDYDYQDFYDSFIVMKVINGVRSFVGRTHKKFIYHELTKEDIGSVYYIVVPIMSEFDIDSPGYSKPIIIDPNGLTEKTKISYQTYLNKDDNRFLSSINDENNQIF